MPHLADDTTESASLGIELEVLIQERREIAGVEVDRELFSSKTWLASQWKAEKARDDKQERR